MNRFLDYISSRLTQLKEERRTGQGMVKLFWDADKEKAEGQTKKWIQDIVAKFVKLTRKENY